MKKIICILLSLVLVSNYTFAQEKTKKVKVKTEAKDNTSGNSREKAISPEAKGEDKVKIKKDGTPDMRYKENKDAAKKAEKDKKLKKDGTPDKRYKENKEVKEEKQK